MNRRLREQSFKVLTFLENLKLELSEMQQYLAMSNGTNTWEEVACQWITSNRDRQRQPEHKIMQNLKSLKNHEKSMDEKLWTGPSSWHTVDSPLAS